MQKRTSYITFLIIPDNQSKSRSYKIKRNSLLTIAIFGLTILGGLVGLTVFYFISINKVVEYDQLDHKYGLLVNENKKINTLYDEFVKVKDENKKIKDLLGISDSLRETTGLDTSEVVIHALFMEPPEKKPENDPFARPVELTLGDYNQIYSDYISYARAVPTVMPTDGFISRRFENDMDKGFETGTRHIGIDIAAVEGTVVRATADGFVVFSDWEPHGGYSIIISHGYGFFTYYEHNKVLLTHKGSFVRRNQVIALVGSTGTLRVGGPHLHYEVWKDGVPKNPEEFIIEKISKTN